MRNSYEYLTNTVVHLTLSDPEGNAYALGKVPNLADGYRVSAPPLCCREPRLGAIIVTIL